ncbi:MAG TPA: hypothetical protein DIW47_03750 [Bacteroidetes bacterium]|nr:hypothetical protein [Bacteroidota bacterium]
MKYLILLIQILVVTESSSQNFKVRYSELGLGSNSYSNYPELHVTINDTLLVYQHIFTVRILEFDSLFNVENCRGIERSTYPEILGKEYDALRQRGDEQMNTEKPPLSTLMDGLYKSNPNSFRNNFYIKITGDTVTLYGWQRGVDKDTVYYKSRTVNTSKEEGWIIWNFDQYKFSSEPIINDNIDGFKENKKIDPFTGTLHNYFLGTYAEGVFKLNATTDNYDSRADVFEFEKIQ